MIFAYQRLNSAWRDPALLGVIMAGLVFLALLLVFGGAGEELSSYGALGLVVVALLGTLMTAPHWPSPWLRAAAWLPWPILVWAALGLLPGFTYLGLAPHPYWEALQSLGLTSAWPSAAVAPVTGLYILALLTAFAVFWQWILRAALAETCAKGLLLLVAVGGTCFAAYGLFEFVRGNTMVLWLPKEAYQGVLSATFISRNHAATMLGLGILAATGLALLRIGEVSGRLPPLQRLKALWLLVLKPGAGWWLAVAVQWSALILTSSRAGLTVALLGWVVLLVALAMARPVVRLWLLGLLGLCLGVGALLLGVLGQNLAARAEALQQADGRAALVQLSGQVIDNGPWVGHGLGGWAGAAVALRGPEVWPQQLDHFGNAHNLYLQTQAELGWPGLLGLLALGGLVLAGLLHGLMTRRRQVIYPAVGLAALGLVAAHSVVDFPLFVPAVMVALMLLVAAGLAQSFRSPDAPLGLAWPARLVRALIPALLSALLAVLVWLQLPLWQAAPVIKQIQAGVLPTGPALVAAGKALQQCVQRAAWQAKCQAGLLQVKLVQLQRLPEVLPAGSPQYKAWLANLEAHGTEALRLAPASPIEAYELAKVTWAQERPQRAALWLTHSILMAPYEQILSAARLPLVYALIQHPAVAAEERSILTDHLANLWRQNPYLLWRALQRNGLDPLLLAQSLAGRPWFDEAQWPNVAEAPWPLGKPAQSP